MRHAAAFCNQFPVTAHIASLILYNPSATADIQEKREFGIRKYL